MMYSKLNIADDKANLIFSALQMPDYGIDLANRRDAVLVPLLLSLKWPELVAFMLRCLDAETVGLTLRHLGDIRVTFATSGCIEDPEILRNRESLSYAVPFLQRYSRAAIPLELWSDAIDAFKKLYADQLSNGIIPDFRMDEWQAYWTEHLPIITRNLKDRGLSVQPPEIGD